MTMSVKALVSALSAIVVLALVVPPAAATWVHHRRIARASSEAGAIADRLRACAAGPLPAALVATGPGNLPVLPAGRGSIQNISVRGEVCGLALVPDPWGNSYLLGPGWVLSAGPNGILETPLPPVGGSVGGDDVGRATTQ